MPLSQSPITRQFFLPKQPLFYGAPMPAGSHQRFTLFPYTTLFRSQSSEVLTWNGAQLHLESSLITCNGGKAELTKNEVKILYYLFKNAGKICSRNDIVDFLWDNQLYVDDNALSVNITRIREKLAGIGLTGFIKTKHRQGYTL